MSTCGACKNTRKFLDENGIDYDLIEVDRLEGSEQWAAMNELKRHNPEATCPTLVIEETIVGYDAAGIGKALDLS